MGNLDPSTYVHVPDWKIPLTKQGFRDGRKAGLEMKRIIGDKPIFFYTSPYMRTKQTLAAIVEAFEDNYIVGVREEPRLTEQQFGNFQNLETIQGSKDERKRFGRFYYRFPEGESGLDVFNRATSFIATMYRDFANESFAREDLNVIIVTHGLTLRLLVMRWFQYSINDFEQTDNPNNGDFVVMERRTDGKRTWFELTEESMKIINFKPQKQFGSLWKLLSELPKEPTEEAEKKPP
jgi:broad specificity phosphatase PhoE